MHRLEKASVGVLVIGVLCVGASSQTDSLPRRGALGVALGVDDAGAVRVTAVQDDSTAAELGIMAKDVIQAIDGVITRTPADVIAAVGKHVRGRNIAIDLVRDGSPQHREGLLKPLVQEKLAGAEMEYGSVVASGARLRTIISIPANMAGRAPAVLLIPGGGCGSIDTPLFPDIAQPGLMRVIGKNGFVTMRVDKSGMGDSEGPPCDSIGYEQELAGYQAALPSAQIASRRGSDTRVSAGGFAWRRVCARPRERNGRRRHRRLRHAGFSTVPLSRASRTVLPGVCLRRHPRGVGEGRRARARDARHL